MFEVIGEDQPVRVQLPEPVQVGRLRNFWESFDLGDKATQGALAMGMIGGLAVLGSVLREGTKDVLRAIQGN